ncbi:N-acetylneuraminate synthase [Flavobacterium aquidurense]|uniref:N-acetylneuraminate synthase n=1 Tax=Flavobacterium aquidurense TaxID=362413 RepID=UPI000915B0C0|nr:N-acetylneuraminate synthase [Flavobacterium aquidurense]OXA71456.1 N-acetylneuraminate synthase [Flavobacterium aquidurense]SHG94707.1 N-acetylneuraminate synthase [Flavobacterium frigidimaris]
MNKVVIIAEAGVNHNGDIRTAKLLIDAAVNAGVDYVKFQTFKADSLVSKSAKKAKYQSININDGDDSQYEMLKKLELSHEDHLELISYCNEKKISFFSTAFDVEGVNYLNDLGLTFFKIPSGEITNYPYLRAVALCGKPVIMSTGMCSEKDIENALDVLLKYGLTKELISILHCNTEYPTPMQDVNLKAMLSIKEKFQTQIGYSDHTLGIEVPIAAVALGAKIIEKHFTLDRNLLGPDHIASLEPDELKEMVATIRNIELAIGGDGQKEASESEKKNIAVARKSIHINKNLQKGQILTENDLISLRPGDGISPMQWENIIGKKLIRDKIEFDKLSFLDIQ